MVNEWLGKVKWVDSIQKLGLTGVILTGAMWVGQQMLENDRTFRDSIVDNDKQFRAQSIETQKSFAKSLDRISDASTDREKHLQEAAKYMQESAAREAKQVEVLGKILEELKQPESTRVEAQRDGG